MYYLTQDIKSNVNGELHASAGTEVKLISALEDHLNVVVVEVNGKKFPVSRKKISSVKPAFSPVSEVKSEPVKPKSTRKKVANSKLF